MSRIFASNSFKVHCLPGERIEAALLDALRLSEQLEVEVILEFNGKEIPCHYRKHKLEDRIKFYFNRD